MTLLHDTHDNNFDINNSRKFSPELLNRLADFMIMIIIIVIWSSLVA